MKLKNISHEDFVNYRLPSMMLASCSCTWKCPIEQGLPVSVCQNSEVANQPTMDIPLDRIVAEYKANPITQAIVIGGLEPMLQFSELIDLIQCLRSSGINDDVVIYTGYREDELTSEIAALKRYPNIVVKFGRYIPGHTPHYDPVLGVELASDDQYAVRIS